MRDQNTLPLFPESYAPQPSYFAALSQDDIPTLKAPRADISQPLTMQWADGSDGTDELGQAIALASPDTQPCEAPAQRQPVVISAAIERAGIHAKPVDRVRPSAGVSVWRSASRLGKYGYRTMQPMGWRDWATVVALVITLIALGAYMTIDKPSATSSSSSSSNSQAHCRWHVVQAGDTLASIARATGVGVGQIARANGIYDVSDPTVGQRLCLPSSIGDVIAGALKVPLASQTNGPVIQGEADFVQFALPYARKAHEATGWPVSVILAQWGLEQGWQAPNFTGYNFGNCGGLVDEPFIPGTAAVGSPSSFAYADTPMDGLSFYIHVAQLPYYNQVAPAAQQGGPEAAARALGASPWDAAHYTDHGDPGSSLVALMQQYNLTQYD